MAIGTLLFILQIIGALPGVIEFAKILWEKIRQIRDRKKRNAYRKEFVATIFKRKSLRQMSMEENNQMLAELHELGSRISADMQSSEG